MKICISSRGNSLDSEVDPRFGRCDYLIFVETDILDFEAIRNPNVDATGGAGIKSAQILINKQVKAVLTGNIGPNAFKTLKMASIDVVTGVSGRVRDVIEKYISGGYKKSI